MALDLSPFMYIFSFLHRQQDFNGQSTDTGNIGLKTQNEDKQNKKCNKETKKMTKDCPFGFLSNI
jgi:hypothetical protein